MKYFLLIMAVVSLNQTMSWAGNDGAHGGDPMKERFIRARKSAISILENPATGKYFTASQRKLMLDKLMTEDPTVNPSECYERKLCWYNEDSQQPPLKAELNGRQIDAILVTTAKIDSAITIDIGRAQTIKVSEKEATVSLLHEAGHAVGITSTISDLLATDGKAIDLLDQAPRIVQPSGGQKSCVNTKEVPISNDLISVEGGCEPVVVPDKEHCGGYLSVQSAFYPKRLVKTLVVVEDTCEKKVLHKELKEQIVASRNYYVGSGNLMTSYDNSVSYTGGIGSCSGSIDGFRDAHYKSARAQCLSERAKVILEIKK